jgi:Aminopeptidase P, N-terminal domain
MRISLRVCGQLREFRCLSPARSWKLLRTHSGRLSAVFGRSYASVSAADLKFGQPLHETHSHLLEFGERKSMVVSYGNPCHIDAEQIAVTPGISAVEYAVRRAKLASHLPDKAIAVLASSDIKYRSGAVFYEFHQDPDFFYLTGMSLFAFLFGCRLTSSRVQRTRSYSCNRYVVSKNVMLSNVLICCRKNGT